jgi:hypothetical protein
MEEVVFLCFFFFLSRYLGHLDWEFDGFLLAYSMLYIPSGQEEGR